jgi:hypothetical protein
MNLNGCNSTNPDGGNGGNPQDNSIYSWKCAPTVDKFPDSPNNALNCDILMTTTTTNSSTGSTTQDNQYQTNENTFTLCDAQCGAGNRYRTSRCASSLGVWVDGKYCLEQKDDLKTRPSTSQTPISQLQCSNYLNCIYQWVCGDKTVNVSSATKFNTGACEGLSFFSKNNAQSTTSSAITALVCNSQLTTLAELFGIKNIKYYTQCKASLGLERSVLCTQNGQVLDDSACDSIKTKKPSMSFTASCTCPSVPPDLGDYELPEEGSNTGGGDDGNTDGGGDNGEGQTDGDGGNDGGNDGDGDSSGASTGTDPPESNPKTSNTIGISVVGVLIGVVIGVIF